MLQEVDLLEREHKSAKAAHLPGPSTGGHPQSSPAARPRSVLCAEIEISAARDSPGTEVAITMAANLLAELHTADSTRWAEVNVQLERFAGNAADKDEPRTFKWHSGLSAEGFLAAFRAAAGLPSHGIDRDDLLVVDASDLGVDVLHWNDMSSALTLVLGSARSMASLRRSDDSSGFGSLASRVIRPLSVSFDPDRVWVGTLAQALARAVVRSGGAGRASTPGDN